VKRIFEMGSAIGYSTIWLARAAGPKGKVHYTDGDSANAKRAAEYFRRAGVAKRINVQVGDALELLGKTFGQFDLIFNDVDKHQYPDALRAALPKLRKGGLFITDNTLWSGKAARAAAPDDAATLGVQVVVSGHSHKPSLERRHGVLFLNPGSAGPRRFRLPIALGELCIEGSSVSARLVELPKRRLLAAL
jgi:predicted O-methyltransferase YrrM